jgi:hypothetical protein
MKIYIIHYWIKHFTLSETTQRKTFLTIVILIEV